MGERLRAGFWGGSADLAPSNMTLMKAFGDFQKNQYQERNLRFGVREHGMGAICNGIALHNPGLIPYCATFFIFTGARPRRWGMAHLDVLLQRASDHFIKCSLQCPLGHRSCGG